MTSIVLKDAPRCGVPFPCGIETGHCDSPCAANLEYVEQLAEMTATPNRGISLPTFPNE